MFAVSCFLIFKLEDAVTQTILTDITSVQILYVTIDGHKMCPAICGQILMRWQLFCKSVLGIDIWHWKSKYISGAKEKESPKM